MLRSVSWFGHMSSDPVREKVCRDELLLHGGNDFAVAAALIDVHDDVDFAVGRRSGHVVCRFSVPRLRAAGEVENDVPAWWHGLVAEIPDAQARRPDVHADEVDGGGVDERHPFAV